MPMMHRRGTAAEWLAANSVLEDGQLGWETDSNFLKIGDGSKAWNRLPYLVGYPRAAAVLTSTAMRIVVTATLAGAGSILARFRTNWDHTDGLSHHLFRAENGGNIVHLDKYIDSKIYVGMLMGGGDQRIQVASGSYAINYQQLHSAAYTWDDAANAQAIYIDGVSVGTSSTAFSLTAPTSITIGNDLAGSENFDGVIYDCMMLDRVITSTEAADYALGVDPALTSGNFCLRFHRKFEDVWNGRTVTLAGGAIKIQP